MNFDIKVQLNRSAMNALLKVHALFKEGSSHLPVLTVMNEIGADEFGILSYHTGCLIVNQNGCCQTPIFWTVFDQLVKKIEQSTTDIRNWNGCRSLTDVVRKILPDISEGNAQLLIDKSDIRSWASGPMYEAYFKGH